MIRAIKVFEVTEFNHRFAGHASMLRELSVLFPMMLGRDQDPAAQLFISLAKMREYIESELKANQGDEPRQQLLYKFSAERLKQLEQVIIEMLDAKKAMKLDRFVADWRTYLEQKLEHAHALIEQGSAILPAGETSWLVTIHDEAQMLQAVTEMYNAGSHGQRLFLFKSVEDCAAAPGLH